MARFISNAQNVFIFATWLVLACLQVILLPLHMTSMLITRGCDAVVAYSADIQREAVAALKGK